jgi:putative DNA modification/repair radical SAM protein
MELERKLAILADAAKYDASCASSGTTARTSRKLGGLGSTTGTGICHSYTPDGRCVSLLKILLTNYCIYDCLYCINRISSNVPRARFTAEEVVQLTLDFYRRNYIEGLFLSSGIIRNPDYTMEQLLAVARALRVDHEFRGYIHLKTIPEASPALIEQAGSYADRVSINIELPTSTALKQLAPEKSFENTHRAMTAIRSRIDESKVRPRGRTKSPAFAPAGQSTQMVIGADESNDDTILKQASTLYSRHRLRRVYYSAFSPIPDPSSRLPLVAPPLVREHRLYQADWLIRFYGFHIEELTPTGSGNLDLVIDPKLSWALGNRHIFPVDLNRATREMLLRVPGLGTKSVDRILRLRRWHKLRLEDLGRLRLPLRKLLPFVTVVNHHPVGDPVSALQNRDAQLDFFGEPASVLTGQL